MDKKLEKPTDFFIAEEKVMFGDGTEVALDKLKALAAEGDPYSLLLYVQLRQLVNLEMGLAQMGRALQGFGLAFGKFTADTQARFEEAKKPENAVSQMLGIVTAMQKAKDSGIDFTNLFGSVAQPPQKGE